MKASDRRSLPRREVSLTRLGLGGAQVGGLYRETSLADAAETVASAWDAGVRYFDTAPYYGYTRSERRFGALLCDRDGFVLSTKAGRLMVPDATVPAEEDGWVRPLPFRPTCDYSHDGILRSFEASQQRLGMIHVDILYVHDIGRTTHGDRHDHYWAQLTKGGGFRALETLREDGRIAAFGLGVNEWEIVHDAMQEIDLDVTMLAGRYTLLEQDSLALLEECRRNGNGIVAAGVFNSGALVGDNKFNYADASETIASRVRALEQACALHDVPLPAAALQFALAHPAVVSCVVGAHGARQFDASVAWLEVPIPDALWQTLRESGLLADAAPSPRQAA